MLELLYALEAAAEKNEYPIGVSSLWSAETKAYIEAHISQTAQEQLRSIQQAIMYAHQPELWYSTQLPIDVKRSIAWCAKFRIPYFSPLGLK